MTFWIFTKCSDKKSLLLSKKNIKYQGIRGTTQVGS